MQSEGMRMRQSRDAAVVAKVKREREIVEEKERIEAKIEKDLGLRRGGKDCNIPRYRNPSDRQRK
ncbi:hypothetical protein E2C01_082669 [Portunus trituberculatus]|uniref:Uncharacterized protein n=1 Tax=Portunus trituberculatus TaxID=210409 RepID=A0A5B7IZ27_PORTR|nr:hypothetical protein [Portunus trituberculatus]